MSKYRRSSAAIAVAAVLLAACGSDGDGVSSGTTTPASAPAGGGSTATTEQSADTPLPDDIDEGAELNYGLNFVNAGGAFFDPADYNSNSAARTWMDLIYDTMIHKTANGSEPGLATEWNAVDQSTIVLTLREGVKFQDGTDFNAEAVKFSWDRFIADPDAVKTPELSALESVDVLGTYEVQMNLSAPLAYGYLERFLRESVSGLGVVSPTAVEKLGADFSKSPVGAGPYSFSEYVPDQRVTVTRFEEYWDASKHHFSKVNVIQTAPGSPTIAGLAAGTLDIASITTADVAAVEPQPRLAVFSEPSDNVMMLSLCQTKPPFDNVSARQAIGEAIDRAAINQVALGGDGEENASPLPNSDPLWSAEVSDSVTFDPEHAEQLLTDVGVAGSKVEMVYSPTPESEGAATIIQGELGDIGLNVELRQVTDVVSDFKTSDPDIVLIVLRPVSQQSVYRTDGVINPCNSDSPELVAAYDAYRDATLTEELQEPLAAEFQQVAIEQAAAIYLATTPNLLGMSDKLQGVNHVKQANQGIDFEGVYLAK